MSIKEHAAESCENIVNLKPAILHIVNMLPKEIKQDINPLLRRSLRRRKFKRGEFREFKFSLPRNKDGNKTPDISNKTSVSFSSLKHAIRLQNKSYVKSKISNSVEMVRRSGYNKNLMISPKLVVK